MIPFISSLVASYLIGGIPFAYIFVRKIKGIDIRTVGSGNAGSTNATRVLGRGMGAIILILDMGKGAFCAWFFAFMLNLIFSSSTGAIFGVLGSRGIGVCMGLAAFLGHCYTPYLAFKGGKGVAVVLGAYLVLAFWATLLTVVVCLVIILATRIVSIASIVGAILLPIAILGFNWSGFGGGTPWPFIGITALLSLSIILRHRGNIKRLLTRTENKVW